MANTHVQYMGYCIHCRLQAVSLFPKYRGEERKIQVCKRDLRVAMPQAASSVGVGRQAKRETALVSFNDLVATLTGCINDTSALFVFYLNRSKLCLVRCDECFNTLQLKPGK